MFLRLPANEALVNLDGTSGLLERAGRHRETDTRQHEPRGLLSACNARWTS